MWLPRSDICTYNMNVRTKNIFTINFVIRSIVYLKMYIMHSWEHPYIIQPGTEQIFTERKIKKACFSAN